MSNLATDTWIVIVDHDDETNFNSRDEAAIHLASLEKRERARISLMVNHGPRKGWRGFVLGGRDADLCFAIEYDSGYASLIYYDKAASEYNAVDEAEPVQPAENIRLKIAHGSELPCPLKHCMSKERAFKAIYAYMKTGERPAWLKYEYVE